MCVGEGIQWQACRPLITHTHLLSMQIHTDLANRLSLLLLLAPRKEENSCHQIFIRHQQRMTWNTLVKVEEKCVATPQKQKWSNTQRHYLETSLDLINLCLSRGCFRIIYTHAKKTKCPQPRLWSCEAVMLIKEKTRLFRSNVEVQILFLMFSIRGEVNVIIGQRVVSK